MSALRIALSVVAALMIASPALAQAPAQAPAQKSKAKAPKSPGATERTAKGSQETPLGSYLAGRYAQLRGKPAAAIEFYRSVLKTDPQNGDVQRRLLAMLAS